MPFGINNPLPSNMNAELRKTAKILASFVDPRQSFGPDKVIPPSVLANAKGLAILTVFKAGFLGSGRFGSGVVVARLADGTWSAPSAIATVGGGFGGQVGFEMTDFVFILNDASAVRTFAQAGSLTLGGNVSIAAGPVGRNAEAAGAASLKSVAGIFAYSKTKGLFVGVSLEGSAIIERRDANEKLYNRRVTARGLLEGTVPVPPQAEPLMRVLNSRVFSGVGVAPGVDAMYNDAPVYSDHHEPVVWQGRRGSAMGEGVRTDRTGQQFGNTNDDGRSELASSWHDGYHQSPSRSSTFSGAGEKVKPARPTAPKPLFAGGKKAAVGPDRAIAKHKFDAVEPGDMGFDKGEIITIIQRTELESDWWKGQIGEDRKGMFPSNYVEMV